MKTPPDVPAEARRWLRDVERRLAPLPVGERHELLSSLTEHFRDAVASGVPADDALARLGSPGEVAERTLEDYQQQTGADARPGYFTAKRVVQAVAMALAGAAALAILLLPSYIVVESDSAGNETISAPTATEVVGPLIYLIVAIPVVITAIPLMTRGRFWQPLSITAAVFLLAFAAVGSLTIGWYLAPAALALVIAACLPTRTRQGS